MRPFQIVSATLSLVVISSVNCNYNTHSYNQAFSTCIISECKPISDAFNPNGSIMFWDYNKYNHNISIIDDFSSLVENWNGYGALPINNDVISRVKEVLGTLFVQPEVFPTGRGGIQVEFQKTDNSYLEFEFFSDGQIGMLKIDSNQNEEARMISALDIPTIVGVFNAV